MVSPSDVIAQDASEPEKDQLVGWIELFYDLIFVGAIVIAASDLEVGESASEFVILTLSAVAGFLTWLMTTLVFNRYPSSGLPKDGRDLRFRTVRLLLVFVQMASLLIAALAVRQSDGGLANFGGVVALAVAQLTIAAMLVAGALSSKERLSTIAAPATLLAGLAVLLGISAAHSDDLEGGALHAVALILQIIIVVLFVTRPSKPIRYEHLAERLGLLTLLAAGESFIALAIPMIDATHIENPALFLIALAYPMAIFGMYFGTAAPLGQVAPRSMILWVAFQGVLVIETAAVGHRLSEVAAEPHRIEEVSELISLSIGIVVQLLALAGLTAIGRRLGRRVVLLYLIAPIGIVFMTILALRNSRSHEWPLVAMVVYVVLIAVVVNMMGLWSRSRVVGKKESQYLTSE